MDRLTTAGSFSSFRDMDDGAVIWGGKMLSVGDNKVSRSRTHVSELNIR